MVLGLTRYDNFKEKIPFITTGKRDRKFTMISAALTIKL